MNLLNYSLITSKLALRTGHEETFVNLWVFGGATHMCFSDFASEALRLDLKGHIYRIFLC